MTRGTPGAALPPHPAATTEEVVPLGGGVTITLVRPRSADDLLDEHAFEHEEFLPYWAEMWPSGVALARSVATRSLRGARTLELGCGLGLASIAAARAGGRVLATDWSPGAIEFTRVNAAANGVVLETLVCSWAEPEALIARGPWDLVLAADVLYERRNVETMLGLLPQLVDARGEVVLADPGRPLTESFLAELDQSWSRLTAPDRDRPSVAVHRLRKR